MMFSLTEHWEGWTAVFVVGTQRTKKAGDFWDVEPRTLHFIQICALLVISLWILQCLANCDTFWVIFLFTPEPLKDPELLEVPISLIMDFAFLHKKRSEEVMWLFIDVAAFPPWPEAGCSLQPSLLKQLEFVPDGSLLYSFL